MASKRKSPGEVGLAGARQMPRKVMPLGKPPKGARIRSTGIAANSPEVYQPPDEHNVRMRKIANGYLIKQHGYQDGKSYEHEHYSQTKPALQFEATKREARLKGKNV